MSSKWLPLATAPILGQPPSDFTVINDLAHEVEEAFRLPDIKGNRCVHSVIENGSCHHCVTACPTDAWIIDDEQVGIQPDLCDGCGLCAAVCPEGAIEHDIHPEISHWGNKSIIMLACERNPASFPESSTIPCVHALGIHHLLSLYRQGCRYLFIQSGDCHSCDRGTGFSITDNVQLINKMLDSLGLPRLLLNSPGETQWRRIHEKLTHTPPEEKLHRRNFLRSAAAKAIEQGIKQTGIDDASDKFIPPGAILPSGNRQGAIFPFVPVLDTTHCTGCNACMRSCPHQAITLTEENGQNACYNINAEMCTGCNICSDVCSDNAIVIEQWKRNDQETIPLIKSRCKSCGIPMNKPISPSQDHSVCHICSRSGHNKNLFQILE